MKKVTSIIVDYNSIDLTKKAISSLLEFEEEFINRIIVVDNYGMIDCSSLLEISNKILIIRPHKNLGFGKAINLAIKYTDTPLVLLQNPDTILHSKILDKMVNTIDKESKIAAITVRAKTSYGTELLARRFTRPSDIVAGRRSPLLKLKPIRQLGERYRYLDKLNKNKPFEVEAFTGTFVLIKTEAFLKANGFDPRFFLFMEDIDLSRKLKELGFKIVLDPTLEIIHFTGSTRKKNPLKSGYTKAKSVYLYFLKWNEIKRVLRPIVGLLLGLYTILTLFLSFIDLHRPELSWKTLSKKRHL